MFSLEANDYVNCGRCYDIVFAVDATAGLFAALKNLNLFFEEDLRSVDCCGTRPLPEFARLKESEPWRK